MEDPKFSGLKVSNDLDFLLKKTSHGSNSIVHHKFYRTHVSCTVFSSPKKQKMETHGFQHLN